MNEKHTIEKALEAQAEALEALRQKAREEPGNVACLKELSMCSRRYGQMIKEYALERRIRELEQREFTTTD